MKDDEPLKGRGGPGRGQGRKSLSGGGETKVRNIRLNDEDWERFKQLGGPVWLRRKIKLARVKKDVDTD